MKLFSLSNVNIIFVGVWDSAKPDFVGVRKGEQSGSADPNENDE